MNLKRQEYKYLVSDADIEFLRTNLKNLLRRDEAAKEKGYTIRTLYFDSFTANDLMDKLHGNYSKRKFRVRFYDNDHSRVKFEIKRRVDGSIFKKSKLVSKELVEELMKGNYSPLLTMDDNDMKRLYFDMSAGAYRPTTIIEYDREAFYLPYNNIRVTLDMNLRTFVNANDFFNNEATPVPVLMDDLHVLEVKWEGFLPAEIKQLISLTKAKRKSICKFSMAAKHLQRNSWEVD